VNSVVGVGIGIGIDGRDRIVVGFGRFSLGEVANVEEMVDGCLSDMLERGESRARSCWQGGDCH